jgi:protein-lysine N-methyltransferase EEF2KMT
MEKLQRQFLENVPVKFVNFNAIVEFIIGQEEVQQSFLDDLFRRPFIPSTQYQISFLKQFSAILEQNNIELCEFYYEKMGELMMENENEFTFKTFYLPNSNEAIIIKEAVASISNGTTGLSTWGASLYLLDYLSTYKHIVQGQRVLELGSGAGLLGIGMKKLGAKSVLMTDGDPNVLKGMRTNIEINRCDCKVERLLWGDKSDISGYEVVICADVVYDPELIDPLLYTLSELIDNDILCLIALTERSKETINSFKNTCLKYNLFPKLVERVPVDWYFIREDVNMIRLFELKKGHYSKIQCNFE